MKGCVVTEFDWMNPHSLIKFDYKTETGEVQKWTMEIGSSEGFLPDVPINLLSRMKKLPEVIIGATLDESLFENKASLTFPFLFRFPF